MLRGDRFRDLRLKYKYTHEELAQNLGIAVRQINRYEAGETDPSADTIARIARFFNDSAEFLHDRVLAHFPRTNADLRGVIQSDGMAHPIDDYDK